MLELDDIGDGRRATGHKKCGGESAMPEPRPQHRAQREHSQDLCQAKRLYHVAQGHAGIVEICGGERQDLEDIVGRQRQDRDGVGKLACRQSDELRPDQAAKSDAPKEGALPRR